jgi:O-antigen/teichoic acid export membrane protein
MTTERRILGNSALLGGLEAIGQVVNLAMVVLLARLFGVAALGAYSFAMALGAALGSLASLGATSYAIREIARDGSRTGALLGAIAPAQALLALAGVGALAGWAALSAADPSQAVAIASVAASHLISRVGALYQAPSIAGERFGRAAWLSLLERVVALVGFSAASAAGAGFAAATLALPAAAVIATALSWILLQREWPLPWQARDPLRTGGALRASLPFLWTSVVATLYQRGGLLILTAFGGTLAAGAFAAGERLLVPCAMLYGTFAAAAFPAFARLGSEPQRLRELAGRCQRIGLLVTAGLSALIALIAPELVRTVWGHPVAEAVPVLRVLALGVVLRSMAALLAAQCQALGAEADAARDRMLALLAFFVIAIPAVRYAGALGLAVAASTSDGLLVAALSLHLRRRGQLAMSVATLARPLLAVAAAAVIIARLPVLPVLGQATMAAALLVATMLASGSVRLHDLRFLREMLRGRSPA